MQMAASSTGGQSLCTASNWPHLFLPAESKESRIDPLQDTRGLLRKQMLVPGGQALPRSLGLMQHLSKGRGQNSTPNCCEGFQEGSIRPD